MNCSLRRPANCSLLALIGALALTAFSAGPAGATLTPDQAFGSDGTMTLEFAAPLDEYYWDSGTVLRDGSVVFLTNQETTTEPPRMRILRPNGRLDRTRGPAYRIPYPQAARSAYAHEFQSSAVERQPDGKLLITGPAMLPARSASRRCGCTKYLPVWSVLRLTRSGRRDRSFGNDGLVLVKDDGKPWESGGIRPGSGPEAIAFDRRGGVLLYGSAPSNETGPVLVRLKKNGDRDRRFGLVVEGRGVDDRAHGGSKLQMALTRSGQVVTVAVENRITTAPQYLDYAVIHRYSPGGKSLKSTKVPLPGVSEVCGRCEDDGSNDLVLAKVLPSGAVLIAGGAGEVGYRSLTKVGPDGALDTKFGTVGRVEMPQGMWLYSRNQPLSVRSNGEIWTVLATMTTEEPAAWFVRFDPGGGLIRASDGAIGDAIAPDSQCKRVGLLDIVGAKLLSHAVCGEPNAAIKPFVLRRWSITT